MGWENKVVWGEGLFLQPQHLQQQERYLERLVRASTAPLRPFAWGLTRLELDRDLLTLGKFAVRAAAGMLPDGTPFAMPDHDDHPRPIDLPETIAQRHRLPHAADPPARRGGNRRARARRDGRPLRRRRARGADSNAGYQSIATVPVGRLRLRFALEGEARAGFAGIALARIIEVRADRSVVLDEGYIPPLLASEASGVLAGFISQVRGCCTTGPRRWPGGCRKPRPAAPPRSRTSCCCSCATATSRC